MLRATGLTTITRCAAATYEVSSDNKAFRSNCCSTSLFGSCLDGTDQMVRLDWYMKDFGNKGGWVVDHCYLKENSDESDV